MEIKDCNEQIDKLIKNTLHEKADCCEATVSLKESIDQMIKEEKNIKLLY